MHGDAIAICANIALLGICGEVRSPAARFANVNLLASWTNGEVGLLSVQHHFIFLLDELQTLTRVDRNTR